MQNFLNVNDYYFIKAKNIDKIDKKIKGCIRCFDIRNPSQNQNDHQYRTRKDILTLLDDKTIILKDISI